MSRFSATGLARNLFRSARVNPSRKTNRLSRTAPTLEDIVLQGSTMSAALAALVEPHQALAAALGDVAMLSARPAPVAAPAETPVAKPAPLADLISGTSAKPSAPETPGESSKWASETTSTPTSPTAALEALFDIEYLARSWSDYGPLPIVRPVMPRPDAAPAAGGGFAAVQPLVAPLKDNGPLASPRPGEAGLSIANDPAAAPTASSRSVPISSRPVLPQLNSGSFKQPETFVSPPNNPFVLEPPAPSRPGPVAQATTDSPIFAVGTDAGVPGKVKVYNAADRSLKFQLTPYGNTFTGGVRVAVADLDGDGTADIVTGQGAGGTNRVRVFSGVDGTPLTGNIGNFLAFAGGQSNGVFVAAGDVDLDGKADVFVGNDGNNTGRLRVYSGATGAILWDKIIPATDLSGGIRVAAGDTTGDGRSDAILTGGGGSSRIVVLDGINGVQVQNYFAFDPTWTGGVQVSVGDITNDGLADVVAGMATGGSMVKVFSGRDTTSVWNNDGFPNMNALGVRVGVVDADSDGKLDLLIGRGPGMGSGQVRVYSAINGQIAAMIPFGAALTAGTFVAGDSRPVEVIGAFTLPNVTISVSLPAVIEANGTQTAQIVLTRDITTGSLTVPVTFGGTATRAASVGDYYANGPAIFSAGQATKSLDVVYYNDTKAEGLETIVASIAAQAGVYTVGSPSEITILLTDDDSPTPISGVMPGGYGGAPNLVSTDQYPSSGTSGPGISGGVGTSTPVLEVTAGTPSSAVGSFMSSSDSPITQVVYPSLSPEIAHWINASYIATGLQSGFGTLESTSPCPSFVSAGFGTTLEFNTVWTNAPVSGTLAVGNGTYLSELPALIQDSTGNTYLQGSGPEEYFDKSGSTYAARHGSLNLLTENTTNKEFKLVDTTGRTLTFHNYDASLPSAERGGLKSVADPNGNTATVSYNGSGQFTQIQRSFTSGGVTTTETLAFTYLTSGSNSGKVSTATLTRQVGAGSATTVRSADLAYYDGATSNGTLGDLKTVTVKDGSGTTLDVRYFRYYVSNTSPGYTGGLKFMVTGAAYDRLSTWATANSTTVDAASDSQVSPFADRYLEYDTVHRATKVAVGAGGCSACSAGIGTYTYSYSTSGFADGYNSWRTKTTETRPDGSAQVNYTNYAGQPILAVHQEGGSEWCTFFKYDSNARLVQIAAPSAVSGYDESKADLLNNQAGNFQYLRDSQGLIGTLSYYSSTTATSSTPGGVTGYLNQSALQRGETGSSILQGATDYLSRTGGSITVYPVANATIYRNTNGTGGQTTSYAWTWNSGTTQPASVTVTHPTVTTAQNGPNSATTDTVYFDSYGRAQWVKDAAGFIAYFEYDNATGGVTKVIGDVDTTQTGTFTNLPSGWSTPTGGGLHQTTSFEVDNLGRTTKVTDPNGNITYTVYLDSAHEVRVYPGWDTGTGAPTGPTIVYREDRARGYSETLTMSATPTTSGGRPTGAESVSGVQTLSRAILNDAGQTVYGDQYFTLSGTSYSASSVTLGSSGTNYNRTQQDYGKLGVPNRTLTPTGTIYRTETDGQGRVTSTWVGTDDTPTSGSWSPTNLTGTNMVKLSENQFDSGSVGDSLLTRMTEIPGGGATDRKTEFAYDWRNRLVATKSGVEASESTSLNRPIGYLEYDNLSEPIIAEAYDGDGLAITTDSNSDGVPDRPSSGSLRAKSTNDFDELNRVYLSKMFSVDPSSGSVSSNSLATNVWRDSRGLTLKASSPGGIVSKMAYNGLGWTNASYVTDGGGDTGYSDADDVTSDNVLSQVEPSYDIGGRTLMVTLKKRFHDETGTGALGTPSTGVKARVSYGTNYYDKANRVTSNVDVGTNGGSSYTRPGTVPSRSDTVLVTDFGYNAAGWTETVTDPRGLVGKTYYDLAGRTTKTIENYVDGTVGDDNDKTVEYGYNGLNQMTSLKAQLTGGGYQETGWVYGITSPVVSNDILKEMRYPDTSTGAASSSEKDAFTYNQLGQVLTKTDRNGNVHTFTYDVLGRVTVDAVTTLGSGVDGTVRRVEIEYDGQGNAYRITTYDASSAGNVVNQVQREFNGLGQLTKEYQAVSGAVNTGSSPNVQYAYSFAPSGSTNHSRLTTLTYPNGRVLTYNYATGLGDNISRLTSITDGGTTLESYEYLGLGTVVKRGHSQSGVDLTYIKQSGESDGAAGDKYIGLDFAGRVIDQRWTTSTPTAKDRFYYGYDRDSNRLYKENALSSADSELYAYDNLNQITSMQRGTLNGTKTGLTGAATRSQAWDFDALGNFDSQTTNGTAQSRSHNKQNEITSIASATTPTYDANGNLTKDETGRTFKYDAWNRLAEVKNSGGTTLATYQWDGLGRRTRETRSGTTTDLYYSAAWQVLEERVSGTTRISYAWSQVYVDAIIARDRDSDSNGSLEERLYVAQDANFNVTALIDTSGTVVERFQYDAFGSFTVLTGAWGARGSSSYGWIYLHQGGRWDIDTAVYSFRHREFSPTLGRWIQMDPVGFDSGDLNLLRGLSNNPGLFLDPAGESVLWDLILIGIGQPIPGTKPGWSVRQGSSIGTSISSRLLALLFPINIPSSWKRYIPQPSWGWLKSAWRYIPNVPDKHIRGTGTFGRVGGRWVPVVGWALLAYDLISGDPTESYGRLCGESGNRGLFRKPPTGEQGNTLLWGLFTTEKGGTLDVILFALYFKDTGPHKSNSNGKKPNHSWSDLHNVPPPLPPNVPKGTQLIWVNTATGGRWYQVIKNRHGQPGLTPYP